MNQNNILYALYDDIFNFFTNDDTTNGRDRLFYNIIFNSTFGAFLIFFFLITYFVSYSLFSVVLFGINVCVIFVGILYLITGLYRLYYAFINADNQFNDGINKLRENCILFAFENYKIIREYTEVYQYHYNDILEKSKGSMKDKINDNMNNTEDILDYVNFILKSDQTEKFSNPDHVKDTINRSVSYIKLCYYLSFIKPSDDLTILNNYVRINIASDSLLNQRNRKLEKLINTIPNEYKHELIYIWNNIHKKESHDIIISLPCKWAIYNYRNMFRYFQILKYSKHIQKSFIDDYTNIETHINNICKSYQKILCNNVLINMNTNKFTNIFTLSIINFIAIHTVGYISSFLGLIISLFIASIIISIITTYIQVFDQLFYDYTNSDDVIMNNINDNNNNKNKHFDGRIIPYNNRQNTQSKNTSGNISGNISEKVKNRQLTIDRKIDTIFDEMMLIMFYGKVIKQNN